MLLVIPKTNHRENLKSILFVTLTTCTQNFLWKVVRSKVQNKVKSHPFLRSAKCAKVDLTQFSQKSCLIDPIPAKIVGRQQVISRLIKWLTRPSLNKMCTIMFIHLNKSKEFRHCLSNRLPPLRPLFLTYRTCLSQQEDLTNFPSACISTFTSDSKVHLKVKSTILFNSTI